MGKVNDTAENRNQFPFSLEFHSEESPHYIFQFQTFNGRDCMPLEIQVISWLDLAILWRQSSGEAYSKYLPFSLVGGKTYIAGNFHSL